MLRKSKPNKLLPLQLASPPTKKRSTFPNFSDDKHLQYHSKDIKIYTKVTARSEERVKSFEGLQRQFLVGIPNRYKNQILNKKARRDAPIIHALDRKNSHNALTNRVIPVNYNLKQENLFQETLTIRKLGHKNSVADLKQLSEKITEERIKDLKVVEKRPSQIEIKHKQRILKSELFALFGKYSLKLNSISITIKENNKMISIPLSDISEILFREENEIMSFISSHMISPNE